MGNMKIGQLSGLTGSSVETIRHYEREGLLPLPPRSDGNYRLYDHTHLERMHFVLHCRSLDMTLEEIRHLLALRDTPEATCDEVNVVLEQHIEHVAERINRLKSLQTQLQALRRQCSSAQLTPDCGILRKLAAVENAAPANLGSHSGGCH